ncbi:MAG: hypothetical protein AAGC49_15690, partial [Brevundimonas sp.]
SLVYELRRPLSVSLGVLLVVTALLTALGGEDGWGPFAVMVGCLVVIALARYLPARRQTARLMARSANPTIRVALAPHSLLLQDPSAQVEIPYVAVRQVLVRCGFVVLRRRGQRPVGFPLAALPPDGLADLRARVTNAYAQPAPSTSTAPPIPAAPPAPTASPVPAAPPGKVDGITREFTADARYPRQLAWVLVQKSFLAPRRLLILLAVAVVGYLVTGALLDDGAARTVVVALVAVPVVVYIAAWRGALRQQPPGSRVVVTIGGDTLAITRTTVHVEVPYSSFERIESHGQLVLFRLRHGPMFWVLPAGVLTPDDLETIRERIG